MRENEFLRERMVDAIPLFTFDMMLCENCDDDDDAPSVTCCDQDSNQDAEMKPLFQELPDVTFIVDGIDFPCHTKILNQHCPILRDIVSIHGVEQRLSKKQRIFQKMMKQHRPTASMLTPSTTTAVELRNVESKVFRALLEFLYTGGVPSELYWCCIEENNNNDKEEEEPTGDDQTLYASMRFLQRLLIVADQFDIVSLKHEVEYKLYDEFLYSFTAAELFVWADSHSCAFLKEKAGERTQVASEASSSS